MIIFNNIKLIVARALSSLIKQSNIITHFIKCIKLSLLNLIYSGIILIISGIILNFYTQSFGSGVCENIVPYLISNFMEYFQIDIITENSLNCLLFSSILVINKIKNIETLDIKMFHTTPLNYLNLSDKDLENRIKSLSDNDNNNSNNVDPKSSLLRFLSFKNHLRSPIFYFYLFFSFLNFLILPYIENNYPLLYKGIFDHITNYYNYYLLAPLSWPLIITFYNVVELYFYTYHCNSNIELKLPKYLPKIFKNNLSDLYTISKSDEIKKLAYTTMLFNNVIFGLILSIISFFAVYLFL